MGLFNLFKRRQDRFIDLLIQQAELTLKGLKQLGKYMATHDKQIAENIRKTEKEADEIRRILIAELNRTFLTPIDREDIFALSRAIDDVVDYAYTTVDEMDMLEVSPTPFLSRISSLLIEAGEELLMAVTRLKDHPSVASEHAMRAKALENRVETIYREALADLFQEAKKTKDVIEIFKLREVYRHLSNAADRGDVAANIIADIVIKIT
jgi:uncharacterized protein